LNCLNVFFLKSVCEAQKTGVPGDLVTVPEAKDKVFINKPKIGYS